MSTFGDFQEDIQFVRRFANAVEANAAAFNAGTNQRLARRISQRGLDGFVAMNAFLAKRHFPANAVTDIPEVFGLLRDRYQLRWVRAISNAFATSAESVPEVDNPHRARVAVGGPQRSILARLRAFLDGRRQADAEEPELEKTGGRTLYGLMRTRLKQRGGTARVMFRIRLVPYLLQLIRQMPRDFEREWLALLQRLRMPPGADPIYVISTGVGPNSCKTCRVLNGRAMTRDAATAAQTRLRPPLFHPNCVHKLQVGGMSGVSQEDYTPEKYGELVTIDVLRKMIQSGQLDEQTSRPARLSV